MSASGISGAYKPLCDSSVVGLESKTIHPSDHEKPQFRWKRAGMAAEKRCLAVARQIHAAGFLNGKDADEMNDRFWEG